MTAVMRGFRILEVAENLFVPAASALLADWGAEVIKIEHVERGDVMRGLVVGGTMDLPPGVHPLFENANRGKQGLALDLTTPDGREILYKLASTADVFMTNKLQNTRKKLEIDVEQIRAHNPSIIYVRGTGHGERGPDAEKGSYDNLAFWARAGLALAAKRPEYDLLPLPPGPGFGDCIGAMTIAGGVMGALLHRERTGEAAVVDVSLFGTGLWAMAQAMTLSMALGVPWTLPEDDQVASNPLWRNYETKDGRILAFCCFQAGKYWSEFCQVIGHLELATDPRFSSHESLVANFAPVVAVLKDVFRSATIGEWRERLASFTGQWTVVQDSLEAAADPQTVANGYTQECHTANGTPLRLITAPVQFDEAPAVTERAPEFNEHCYTILAGLGLSQDAILDLKVRGVIA
jgi:crotonobetainyl-CoA:carnitine CoA-transferase CaiB-like acyl-CoA transferase